MSVEGLVLVSRKGEARILRGHPWVFRADVAKARDAGPGAVVRVATERGKPLGFALYSSRSEIRLRMVARGEELPGDWLRERLVAAIAWRDQVAQGAEACRLVHGEGDRLPSLVVDRYGEHLAIQTLSQGMERLKDEIVGILVERLRPRGILERNDPKVRALEGLESRISLLHGAVPERVPVREGGVVLEADLWRGQKTGLFLDQRENHIMARAYARGRTLDAFCYAGGFALQAASAADSVLAVDLSAEALEQVRRNASANGLANVETRDANVFDVLRELDDRGEGFDTVILDPPAFAKSKGAVEKARRGYKEINLRALKILRPGGCLITCSCSYHVHEPEFEEILAGAAVDAGAAVSVVEKRRQARDHPVLLGVPETYYLKCFVLRKAA
ncbi:MAG TPA: class I SAM-dependent rRNA methyltransferase [Vicinamibacteria bacterium]|nr:class I SAM-dependent rRNA methyltransferase [Vicinamibacteria bacterium]